jgi:UDP-N-acetylmuramate dehydrogenase
MQILYNEDLRKYTTIKIGGVAKSLFIPESVDELVVLIKKIDRKDYYILGGGSNILINDSKIYNNIILVTKMDNTIISKGNGKFYVGASVRLKKLINTTNQKGFGGIEYLYSVPGLVGGAIVMNAGRGIKSGKSISDYIEDVKIYDRGFIKVLNNEDCGFKYRNSVFQDNKSIILGATFVFDKIEIVKSTKAKEDRIMLCKKKQDNSGYNFGSVFKEYNKWIMWLFKLFHPGYKNGVFFSPKSINWIVNKGEGSYLQTITLINKVIRLHKLLKKRAIPEIMIWD